MADTHQEGKGMSRGTYFFMNHPGPTSSIGSKGTVYPVVRCEEKLSGAKMCLIAMVAACILLAWLVVVVEGREGVPLPRPAPSVTA